MKYIIIGIVIAALFVAILVTFILISSKKKHKKVAKKHSQTIPNEDILAKEPIIKVETISAEAIPDESKLVHIKDKKVLARITDLIPSLAQISNNVKNTSNAIKLSIGKPATILTPKGVKLAKSKALEGAYRGIYHDNKGIEGHADIIFLDIDGKATFIANSVATVMNVASMVVGQYYMNQVDSQLEVINKELDKISNFQDNEYRSRVISLITHIKTIADFQVEIIDVDELRLSKIAQLNNLEQECTQLLAQANLTIAEFINKNNINFKDYETQTKLAQDWYMYQQSLIEVLYQIANLKYALHLGTVSREQCSDLLKTYINQVLEAREKLAKWHKETIERLKIDTTEIRRKRDGIDGVMHFIPGLFNDKLNFTKINQTTIDMIKLQTDENSPTCEPNATELYSKSVQLISKNGEIYYLPNDD